MISALGSRSWFAVMNVSRSAARWVSQEFRPLQRAFPRAGPREFLHFDPSKVNAAIVTCGGLCPGLNNVIREVVHTLTYMYGVNKVWGIVGGFQGFHNPDVTAGGEFAPIELTNKVVENIHHEGTYEKKEVSQNGRCSTMVLVISICNCP